MSGARSLPAFLKPPLARFATCPSSGEPEGKSEERQGAPRFLM
jgi:hypothetical protein